MLDDNEVAVQEQETEQETEVIRKGHSLWFWMTLLGAIMIVFYLAPEQLLELLKTSAALIIGILMLVFGGTLTLMGFPENFREE